MNRPNLVFVDCHDLGTWLGCYGREYLRTPNIDSIAGHGARFGNYFSTCPICMPARATMYTGHYPHVVGCHGQMANDASSVHINKMLRDAGYRTLSYGWNIKSTREWAEIECPGPRPGTDESLEHFAANIRDSDRPFFAHFSFGLVHRPFGADYDPELAGRVPLPPSWPQTDIARRDLATLCHQIEQLDAHVGRILQTLEALGHANNTLVVFTTDHGAALLRAKHTMYDAGSHVSLLMRLPGVIKPNAVSNALTGSIDLVPTVLDLLGITADPAVPGRSQRAFLTGESEPVPAEAVFIEHTWDRAGISDRTRDMCVPVRAVRTEKYKLIRNYTSLPPTIDTNWLERYCGHEDILKEIEERYGALSPPWELYDLESDPWEQTNLADNPAHRRTLEQLRATLQTHLERTNDPILKGPDIPHREPVTHMPMWVREEGDDHHHLAPGCPSEETGQEKPFPIPHQP